MDKWMSQPTALKIVSVVIAVMLWAVVHLDQEAPATTVTSSTDTKIFEALQIRPEGLDETKYALVGMEPTSVRMVVQGRRSELLTADDSDYQVKADLSGLGPGEHYLALKADLPNGVQATEMSPSSVKVEIVEIETKAFDVQVETEGQPAEGYLIGDATVSSPSVNVILPKDEMPFVAAVKVKVNIDGATGTVTDRKAKVVVYDTEGKEMTDAKVSPETVEVQQSVLPPSKELPLKISYTGQLPEGVSIDSLYASEDRVVVYASRKVLDEMDSYSGVVVDLSKLTESGSMEVKLKLADGVVKTEPSAVTVTYKVDQAEEKTLSGVPIDATGLEDGLKAEWETPEAGLLDLTVSGSKELLAGLQASDVRVTADLTGLAAGKHNVELKVDLPSFVYLKEGQELTATVVLSDASATPTPGDSPPATGTGGTAPPDSDGSTGVFDPDEGEAGNDGGSGSEESSEEPGNGSADDSGSGNATNKPGNE